ncbi:MAG: 50S ribosomal protein L23 [bacterium]
MNTEIYDHIETILLTEKATVMSEKLNKYVFRVRPSANKIQIKRAIEMVFKKNVVDVNTANFAGKRKRERRADFGRQANWKKAIVTLKEGEKIDLV